MVAWSDVRQKRFLLLLVVLVGFALNDSLLARQRQEVSTAVTKFDDPPGITTAASRIVSSEPAAVPPVMFAPIANIIANKNAMVTFPTTTTNDASTDSSDASEGSSTGADEHNDGWMKKMWKIPVGHRPLHLRKPAWPESVKVPPVTDEPFEALNAMNLKDYLGFSNTTCDPASGAVHCADDVVEVKDVQRRTMAELYATYGLQHEFLPVCSLNATTALLEASHVPCPRDLPTKKQGFQGCNKTLRQGVLVNYLSRSSPKAIITDDSQLKNELKGMSSMFSSAYVYSSSTMSLEPRLWQEVLDDKDNKMDKVEVLSAESSPYSSKPTAVVGTSAFPWSSALEYLQQKQSAVDLDDNLYFLLQDLNMPEESRNRAIQTFAEAVCRLSPKYLIGVIADVVVVRPPLGFFDATTCAQADVALLPHHYPGMAVMASYPRSGNHFLRMLIEKATGIASGSVYGDKTDIIAGYKAEAAWNEHPDIVGVMVVKDHHAPPLEPLLGRKVIFLVRNPLESIWSYFNFKTKYKEIKEGIVEDQFIQTPEFDSEMKRWYDHANYFLSNVTDDKLLLVRYEDLVNNTTEELSRVLDFLDFEPNPALVECAVATSGCRATPAICRNGKSVYDVLTHEEIEKALTSEIKNTLRRIGYRV